MESSLNYSSVINGLWSWAQRINGNLVQGVSPLINPAVAQSITGQMTSLASMVKPEYPYYSEVLLEIRHILFRGNSYGAYELNTAAFGELFLIVKHLQKEPINLNFWQEIHPRIQKVARNLCSDGYYDSATTSAIKEVEQRLREVFVEVRPTSKVPKDAASIVGALFSENGAYRVSAGITPSDKSYNRGVHHLFDGFLAAYRNPSAHENKVISKREAIEQIVLSSQLMYILDSGVAADVEA